MRHPARGMLLVGAALVAVAAAPAAVDRWAGWAPAAPVDALLPRESGPTGGPPYDGRFTFLRVRFETGGRAMRGFGFGGRGGEPEWAHDSPRAERNFAEILEATTLIGPHTKESAGRVLTLDDPELFKYPVAYIVEVGFWRPVEAEILALREFLLKGGFLFVDDFRGPDMRNFQDQMARVLPGVRMIPLPADHEIFDIFFHIDDPASLAPPTYPQYPPVYLGMFEDDDPSGRIMVMINYNNDLAEYWEYSDRGFLPIDLTNEAYKFGVNYIIYGMTH